MVWEDEPELFLFRGSNGHIYTKRCLNMTKQVPLRVDDFDDEHLYTLGRYRQLVKPNTIWLRSDLVNLLDYISPKHYLVNCQGLVFLAVYQFDYDLNGIITNMGGRLTTIFVRLLDVIDLTNFGFLTRPNKVPPRNPKYLLDGFDAQVEDPPPPPAVVDVEDIEDPPPAVVDVEDGRPTFDPSWMTDNWESDWVDTNGLATKIITRENLMKGITKAGTSFGDDDTTNVGRDYFYGVVPLPGGGSGDGRNVKGPVVFFPVKVVAALGDRYPQARFNPNIWGIFDNNGTLYPARMTDGTPW